MPENYREKTNLGDIVIPRSLIADIVVDQMRPFKNKVFLTNNKGKIPNIVTRTFSAVTPSNIHINIDEKNIDIKFYVVIKFGISISQTINELIDNIKNRITANIGVAPKSVSVIVTGTMSKNIAKRNIEVKKNYDID